MNYIWYKLWQYSLLNKFSRGTLCAVQYTGCMYAACGYAVHIHYRLLLFRESARIVGGPSYNSVSVWLEIHFWLLTSPRKMNCKLLKKAVETMTVCKNWQFWQGISVTSKYPELQSDIFKFWLFSYKYCNDFDS
jgi:hypothetical protein